MNAQYFLDDSPAAIHMKHLYPYEKAENLNILNPSKYVIYKCEEEVVEFIKDRVPF